MVVVVVVVMEVLPPQQSKLLYARAEPQPAMTLLSVTFIYCLSSPASISAYIFYIYSGSFYIFLYLP